MRAGAKVPCRTPRVRFEIRTLPAFPEGSPVILALVLSPHRDEQSWQSRNQSQPRNRPLAALARLTPTADS